MLWLYIMVFNEPGLSILTLEGKKLKNYTIGIRLHNVPTEVSNYPLF